MTSRRPFLFRILCAQNLRSAALQMTLQRRKVVPMSESYVIGNAICVPGICKQRSATHFIEFGVTP